MKHKTTTVLLAFAAGALVTGLGAAVYVNKKLSDYQISQPPHVPFEKGECKVRGLVAHWDFEKLNEDLAPDRSRAGHHGRVGFGPLPLAELRFGAPKVVPGRIGQALELSGRQWVRAGNNACLATDQFTVAAWVWQEDEIWRVPTIAAKSAWPKNGWWLCTTSKGTQKEDRMVDVGIAWGSGMTHVESGYQLPLREWHHIVVTMDNVNQEAEFFIDGTRFGKKHTNVPKWLINFESDFVVGDYDGTGRWPWHGKLDDVRVYNLVLTEAEAKDLYQQGLTGAH